MGRWPPRFGWCAHTPLPPPAHPAYPCAYLGILHCCGGGSQDYAPDKAAEIPKEVKRWIIKRPDLVRLAASVGYVVNPGDPIPLDAMPGIWKAHAAARAARLHDVSDQDRLLLELGNVLLVRYGRGMPAAQTVTLLDAHPPVRGHEQ